MKPTKPTKALSVNLDFSAAQSHAEAFVSFGRKAAHHFILLGMELLRLKEQHGETRGGDRKSGKNQKSEIPTFEECVMSKIPLERSMLFKAIQAARAQLPALVGSLQLENREDCFNEPGLLVIDIDSCCDPEDVESAVKTIAEGKTLEQLLLPLDGNGSFDPTRLTGKAKDAWEKIVALCDPYDDDHVGPAIFTAEEHEAMHEDALVMRARVEAGDIPPARAWAGLRGRAATEGGGRNETNHYRNLVIGHVKMAHSLRYWEELNGEDRASVEGLFMALFAAMPSTWTATARKVMALDDKARSELAERLPAMMKSIQEEWK